MALSKEYTMSFVLALFLPTHTQQLCPQMGSSGLCASVVRFRSKNLGRFTCCQYAGWEFVMLWVAKWKLQQLFSVTFMMRSFWFYLHGEKYSFKEGKECGTVEHRRTSQGKGRLHLQQCVGLMVMSPSSKCDSSLGNPVGTCRRYRYCRGFWDACLWAVPRKAAQVNVAKPAGISMVVSYSWILSCPDRAVVRGGLQLLSLLILQEEKGRAVILGPTRQLCRL